MKVFFHNDNDGRCAAYLFWRWITNLGLDVSQEDFFEVDYNIPLPLHLIKKDESVYFLDFNPEKDEDYIWLSNNTDLNIIDHHVSTKPHLHNLDKYYNIIPNPNHIIDIEHCGAMLVAKHFLKYSDDDMPFYISLVDDWDRWQLKLPESVEFNAGSKTYDTSPFSGFWERLHNGFSPDNFYDEVYTRGKTVLLYTDVLAKELCSSIGFPIYFQGYNCFVLNQARCNSNWFNSVPGFDIYISFYFNGDSYSVSLYSESVDVSVIAKSFGGGGHKGASGFNCKKLPFSYSEIEPE